MSRYSTRHTSHTFTLLANSIRDWADVSAGISIRAKLCLLYLTEVGAVGWLSLNWFFT